MKIAMDSELVISSIVLVLDSIKRVDIPPRELEAKFGSIVDTGEGVVTPQGAGLVIRVQKRNLEIVLLPRRWEFHSRSGIVDEETAKVMSNAVHILASFIGDTPFTAIGYNYNMVLSASGKEMAIETIRDSVLDVPMVSKKLESKVTGVSIGLYLDVKGRNLWLRVEPRGGERNSERVWAYGNFEEKLEKVLPTETELIKEFLLLHSIFIDLLKRL